MGNDYVLVKANGFDIRKAFNILKQKEIVETSFQTLLINIKKQVDASAVSEIELGQSGTKTSIIRFRDGNWIVVNGTIRELGRIK